MTDSHTRLLAAVARHRETKSGDYKSSARPTTRKQAELSDRATRARGQVSAAHARRRDPNGDDEGHS
jgi:hypothetical protein